MRQHRTLGRYRSLLTRYLRSQGPMMILLGVILCGSIAVQLATPLATSRFIDRATSSGPEQGVIVTDSPQVWYLEDADGDGRADFVGGDRDLDHRVDFADYDKDHDGVFEKRMFDDDGDGLLDRSVRRR